MHLLLTNDDGIRAPGLAALAEAADRHGTATIVAPHEHLSGCSHQVNTDRPLRVRGHEVRRFSVDGTPADCVRVGVAHLASDVDWVLSGINQGGNLGVDVYMSGTVAAVREAVLLGRPGIAFSQYRRRAVEIDWRRSARQVSRVLDRLLDEPLASGEFWNVNLPCGGAEDAADDAEIVFCDLEPGHLQVEYEVDGEHYHYRGVYHDRPRTTGRDVDVCFSGKIAVTKLKLGV